MFGIWCCNTGFDYIAKGHQNVVLFEVSFHMPIFMLASVQVGCQILLEVATSQLANLLEWISNIS